MIIGRAAGQSVTVAGCEVTITKINSAWIALLLSDGTEVELLAAETVVINQAVMSFRWIRRGFIKLKVVSPDHIAVWRSELMCA